MIIQDKYKNSQCNIQQGRRTVNKGLAWCERQQPRRCCGGSQCLRGLGSEGAKDNWIRYAKLNIFQVQQKEDPNGIDVRVEPKFTIPDGNPYTGGWCRPQTDGPALRAMALSKWAFLMCFFMVFDQSKKCDGTFLMLSVFDAGGVCWWLGRTERPRLWPMFGRASASTWSGSPPTGGREGEFLKPLNVLSTSEPTPGTDFIEYLSMIPSDFFKSCYILM